MSTQGNVVDFIVCGAQKAGTTALHSYLTDHPDLQLASRKEVHFFDNEEHFAAGSPDYELYHSFFDADRASRLRGEVTPIYLYWHPAPSRMRDYNPHLKLIVMLRNPVERAYSHWSMEVRRDAETLPFDEALKAETERKAQAQPLQDRVHSYADRGFYARQLKELYRHFPTEQVLVLDSDVLRSQPAAALDRIAGFLAIGPFTHVEPRQIHADQDRAAMSQWALTYLTEQYQADVEELATMIEWDCRRWLSPVAFRAPVDNRSATS